MTSGRLCGVDPRDAVERVLGEMDAFVRTLSRRRVPAGEVPAREAPVEYLARMETQAAERLATIQAGRWLLERCAAVLGALERAALPEATRAELGDRLVGRSQKLFDALQQALRAPG